jgi:hypothetical protein
MALRHKPQTRREESDRPRRTSSPTMADEQRLLGKGQKSLCKKAPQEEEKCVLSDLTPLHVRPIPASLDVRASILWIDNRWGRQGPPGAQDADDEKGALAHIPAQSQSFTRLGGSGHEWAATCWHRATASRRVRSATWLMRRYKTQAGSVLVRSLVLDEFRASRTGGQKRSDLGRNGRTGLEQDR